MNNIDFDSTELCLIDSGIKSLQKIPLRPQIQVLNLHSNFIHRIENLFHLRNLKHLDLSANQISKIEGIENLTNLRTINLSCNHLSDIRGLNGLRSLVKINLSYNHISDISGFKSLHGSEYKLSHVELHGNQLSSPQHVIKALIGCSNLRQLTLCLDGSSNPLCSDLDKYRSRLLSALTQLEVLDGVNRLGESVSSFDVLADIPGLENYMDFLVSQSSSVSDSKSVDVVTPKIDQALEKFRQRKSPTFTSEMSATASDADTSAGISVGSKQSVADQEARLEFLELQLAQLIQGSKKSSLEERKASEKKHVAKRDVDSTDESDCSSLRRRSKSPGNRKQRRSKIPSYRKSTAASRSRKEASSPSREGTSPSPPVNRLTTIDKGFCNYYSSELYNLQFVKTRKWWTRNGDREPPTAVTDLLV
uniref:Leucine-rich repeat and coiled-coil domain-containing protein 1 n=1 Tax=Magallana gigas TaxID=29159 RepID=A0A8W8KGC5_MAGGI